METHKLKGRVVTNQFTKHGTVSGIWLPDPRFPTLTADSQVSGSEPSLYVSGCLPLGAEMELKGTVK